jgi:ABC-type lipoprotein export system ATPase subunit
MMESITKSNNIVKNTDVSSINENLLTEETILLEDVVKLDVTGRRVINGLSLRVYSGEKVRIAGGAGSGKTCLIRLISGMESPDSGKVSVLGHPLYEMNADTRAEFRSIHIGLVSRYPAFLRRLTVLENVAMPLTLRGVSLAEREKYARTQLKKLELLYIAQSRSSQLTMYELQAASVARALVSQPEILLLDDMSADLSIKDKEKMGDLLRGVHKSSGYTILELISGENSILDADRKFSLTKGKVSI